MKENRILFQLLAATIMACTSIAQGQAARDIDGATDHPMVSRYPSSYISFNQNEEFNDYQLPVSPAPRKSRNTQEFELLHGKLTRLSYDLPHDRSSLEVFKNYRDELSDTGFRFLFECNEKQCGNSYRWSNTSLDRGSRLAGRDNTQHYLAGVLNRPEDNVYIALYVVRRSTKNLVAHLDILEEQAMETGMVTVNAKYLQDELNETGKVALYSLYFDHDKATLTAESTPALGVVATLLNQHRDLQLFVVGHTDYIGSLNYNMDLSRRRAQSTVTALIERYGIDADRLNAQGVGPLAPVGSNESEQGRALNRRVELVKK